MLHELLAGKVIARGWGVYLGREALRDGKVDVLPFAEFARRLAAGRIVG